MMEALQIPDNVPQTIKCQGCGEPMVWQPINKWAGYWLHKDKSIDICASKNPLHPGKPLIAQNLHFYRTVGGIWEQVMGVSLPRVSAYSKK